MNAAPVRRFGPGGNGAGHDGVDGFLAPRASTPASAQDVRTIGKPIMLTPL
jgi:hypothetical protein